ncbi:fungal-specific transcription factor domain-containing protein [Cercophora newfieldiana]|uniref:Fungal-specific transcription factor domain-containing protein n=1 Tax=Cercophora newfieldiana TaxID=92897 RepID=A0AA39YAI3_9PEZI|nr:fungal-specific transcription factor domain-containing protein [Cercophora newfieldiana]
MVGTPIPRRKRRASSTEETVRDYASPSPDAQPRPSNKQQIRHRASVACASCRERRIRCVVPEGQTECTQCGRAGISCIIKNDDERRRPISKAYMSSLSNRIALLEGMLVEQGVQPPPAVHPPKTRQEAQERQEEEQGSSGRAPVRSPEASQQPSAADRQAALTPPSSVDEDVETRKLKQEESTVSVTDSAHLSLIENSLLQGFEPKQDGNVRHLLSTRGRLSCDHSAARVRYFGPTANIHVYAESSCQFNPREPTEQVQRIERAIRALSLPTHDHLMGCFWDYFNAAYQVVDQATFEADRVSQDPKFYSPFLHIAMLAAGYRFADKSRDDVRRLAAGSWESTLHKEAKSVLDMELERLGEVPSVQALIILADLECGVGRDTQGWMISGMASRLSFDIGLHVNLSDTSETERRVRRQVMSACVTLDRQLAGFLGRPTSIKSQDVGIILAPRDLSILSMESAVFGLPEFDRKPNLLTDAAIRPHMMELMELASSILDSQNMCQDPVSTSTGGEVGRYMQTVAMDRQLQNWYRRLPGFLAWTPLNVKAAPLSFFMLHQAFHVYMILLHRPWARYGPAVNDTLPASGAFAATVEAFSRHFGSSDPASIDNNKVAMARNMCTQHAIRVARIFWQHRQRYDGKKISLVAAQHAGTAALALMGALAHKNKELDQQSNLRYLQVLSSAIYDMSHTYHPAARMYHLLKNMLVDIRKEMVNSRNQESDALLHQFQHNASGMTFQPRYSWAAGAPSVYPLLPTVQESSESPTAQPAKKRRLSERRPSELDPQAGSLLLMETGYNYPSPPTSSNSLRDPSADKPDAGSPDVSVLEDATGFDFDFLSESVVDYDGAQGDTIEVAVMSVDDAASAAPGAEENTEAPKDGPESVSKLQGQEDEETADMTIEEWLSEPRVGTPRPQRDIESSKDDITVEDIFGDKPATAAVNAPSAAIEENDCNNLQWLVDMDDAAGAVQAEISLSDLVETVVQKETEKRPVRNLDLDFLRL